MANNSKIPFLDLVASHQFLKDDLTTVLQSVLASGTFVGGAMVEGFESAFGHFCDTEHCIGVASGTDAVRFALLAAGVRPGDAVVTVPNTFIATTEAISQAGAHIEFVDIDERTYTMDPAKLRHFLELECEIDETTSKLVRVRDRRPVTGVIPVHLYGQPADMDAIVSLARKYGLLVIEDACQAHGAQYYSQENNRWMKAGSIGDAAAFSFYPGKNLGACGEGGAITTNSADVARFCRMLRDHGQSRKYYHELEGYNGRLDALQAGFLTVKLGYLETWTEKRRRHARRYNQLLASLAQSVVTPYETSYARPVYHLYVVNIDDRNEVRSMLDELGIGTGIHYPVPLHAQKAYEHLGYREGDFPVTERLAPRLLSLPMFPELLAEQQDKVVQALSESIIKCASGLSAAAAI